MGTVLYLQVRCPHLDIKKLVYGTTKSHQGALLHSAVVIAITAWSKMRHGSSR